MRVGRSRGPITHVLWGTPQVNLMYPADTLGSRKERPWDKQNTPPNIISLESYIVNTGDLRKDAKEGGSRKARAV